MTLTNRLLGIALLLSLLLAVEGIAAGKEKKGIEKHAENLLKQMESVLGLGEERGWHAFDRLASQDSDRSEWSRVARADLDIVLDKPDDVKSGAKAVIGKHAKHADKENLTTFPGPRGRWFRVRPVSSGDFSNLCSELSKLEVTRYRNDVPLDTSKRSAPNQDTLKNKNKEIIAEDIAKEIASCQKSRTKANLLFVFNTQMRGVQRVLKHTFSPEVLSPSNDEGAASEDIQKKFQFKDYYLVSPDVWENSRESKKSLEALKTFGGESKRGQTVKALPSMRCNPVTGELTFFLKEGTTTKEGWDELLKVFVEQIFSSRSNRPR